MVNASTFSSALSKFFEDNKDDLGGSSVIQSAFSGITNEVPPPPRSPPSRTPRIVGGVLGGLAGAVLLAVCAVFFLKRHTEEVTNQYYQEAMDVVDNEIDDMKTLPADLLPRNVRILNDEEEEDEAMADGPIPIYSATADTRSRAVEFIGTAAGDDPDLATAPPTAVQRERMREETKRELGPTAYEPQISRGYGVSDTVDL